MTIWHWTTEDILRGKKSNFFSAFYFLSASQKKALTIVYAFCHLADNIADSHEEKQLKLDQIQFLKEELQNAFKKNPKTALGRDLCWAIHTFKIDIRVMDDLIQGVLMDIHHQFPRNQNELFEYCYHVAGTVGIMCLSIFDTDNDESRLFAKSLGTALQLTNMLRDIKEDYEDQRIYLPETEMQKFQLNYEDLFHQVPDERFLKWVDFQIQRAKRFYDDAWNELVMMDQKKYLPAKIMGKTYYKILKKIIANPEIILRSRIQLSSYEKISAAVFTWISN